MPLDEGGVAIPHSEEGLHSGSFPPQKELSSQVEFCKEKTITLTAHNALRGGLGSRRGESD